MQGVVCFGETHHTAAQCHSHYHIECLLHAAHPQLLHVTGVHLTTVLNTPHHVHWYSPLVISPHHNTTYLATQHRSTHVSFTVCPHRLSTSSKNPLLTGTLHISLLLTKLLHNNLLIMDLNISVSHKVVQLGLFLTSARAHTCTHAHTHKRTHKHNITHQTICFQSSLSTTDHVTKFFLHQYLKTPKILLHFQFPTCHFPTQQTAPGIKLNLLLNLH
jgi:hypothetical protein